MQEKWLEKFRQTMQIAQNGPQKKAHRRGGAPFEWDRSFFFGQEGIVKAVGQQVMEGQIQGLPLAVEADDLNVRGKFLHKLPAHPAGIAVILTAAGNDDAGE